MFYLWVLLGLFLTDAACFRLPDVFTLPLLMIGVCLGTLRFGILHSAMSAVVGAAALWFLALGYSRSRRQEGIGFGDIKMMAGLAAATGIMALPWITLLAAISALAVAGGSALQGKQVHADMPVAFGCYLAISGGLVTLFMAWSG